MQGLGPVLALQPLLFLGLGLLSHETEEGCSDDGKGSFLARRKKGLRPKKKSRCCPSANSKFRATGSCGPSRPGANLRQTFPLLPQPLPHPPPGPAGPSLPKLKPCSLFSPHPTREHFQKINKNTETKSETEVQLSAHSSCGCPITPENPWQAGASDSSPQTQLKRNCHSPSTFHVPETTASQKLHTLEAGLTFPFH